MVVPAAKDIRVATAAERRVNILALPNLMRVGHTESQPESKLLATTADRKG